MSDLLVDGDSGDLHAILERVAKPGDTFNVNGNPVGHVISLTEPERARLETLLRIAVSGDEASEDVS